MYKNLRGNVLAFSKNRVEDVKSQGKFQSNRHFRDKIGKKKEKKLEDREKKKKRGLQAVNLTNQKPDCGQPFVCTNDVPSDSKHMIEYRQDVVSV